jgi:pimeloyl-ACP methyl ester carboxylesterase
MSAASGATHNLLELDRKRTTSEVLTGSVINPGGPGGSGVDAVLNAGPELFTGPGAEVRARFDIVGFDPRGIARSTALRCFGNSRQWGGYFTPFAFPSTPQEEQVWIGADLFLDGNCAQRGGSIADHMSTANVARDLDVLRRAVDDDGLTYYGVSYGSYLGVTYANLFPNRVRALVVDGVLDPIEWATGVGNEGSTIPFSTRLKSDVGAQATLQEFFRLCDAGGPACAFGPNAAARFADLASRLKSHPVPVTLPDGSELNLNYSVLIGIMLGAMYDSLSWEDFAQTLAAIDSQVDPAALGARVQRFLGAPGYITKRGFPQYQNFLGDSPPSPARIRTTRILTRPGPRPAQPRTRPTGTSAASGRGPPRSVPPGRTQTQIAISDLSTTLRRTPCSSSATGSIRRPAMRGR